MKTFDIAVIGGGVVGGLILRELSRYDISVCLLEKENDVCMGQSKANSGIVHAGFDAAEGTLKAKFNLLGNKMMKKTAEELGVKYENNGSLVVAFSEEERETLRELKKRGEKNGVSDIDILSAEDVKKLEPNISDDVKGGLYAKTGGIVCPYELAIAAIGNAMDNGARLFTDFEVVKIDGEYGDFTLTTLDGREIKAKCVINSAGMGSQRIANLVGDYSFKIGARRGEYILLDRASGYIVNRTLFFTPTKMGKGILVSKTVDGNIILGPTAEEIDEEDKSTTKEGLKSVIEKANKMCKNLPLFNTITSFAGVRAYSDRHDFIIEESPFKEGFINLAGIESPGLTSAPAIAVYVAEELVSKRIKLELKNDFDPIRKPDGFFKDL
ncbi:MAG: NAD(P)/FAD-dependent oxidoreductase, partial [Clostridia bacterium]|nr:NAD(P)/FAD-dependent oxidoreductase [Clostridia bacterium]